MPPCAGHERVQARDEIVTAPSLHPAGLENSLRTMFPLEAFLFPWMRQASSPLSVIFNWTASFATGLAPTAAPCTANGLAQSMGLVPGSRILSNRWVRRHRGGVAISCTLAAGLMAAVKR